MQHYTFVLTRKDEEGDEVEGTQFAVSCRKNLAKDIKSALEGIENTEVKVTTTEVQEVEL